LQAKQSKIAEAESNKPQLSLEDLVADDEDVQEIIQESVEFQEVKSKRTVAQEKKGNETSVHNAVPVATPRRNDRRESRTASKDTHDRGGPSTPAPPPTPPTPLVTPPAPPVQQAWVDTEKTFKVIGVPVPQSLLAASKLESNKKLENSKSRVDKRGKNGGEKRVGLEKGKKERLLSQIERSSKKLNKSSALALQQNVDSSRRQKGNESGASSASIIFDVGRELLEPNSGSRNVVNFSTEKQNDEKSASNFSRFVPGVALTRTGGQDEENMGEKKNNQASSSGTDPAALQALIGLGATASITTFDSNSTWQFGEDEASSFRPHANSNVSDDENAYTHHTEALTQLTEGDDDNDLGTPYVHSSPSEEEPSKATGLDEASEKTGGSERRPSKRGGKKGRGRGGRQTDKLLAPDLKGLAKISRPRKPPRQVVVIASKITNKQGESTNEKPKVIQIQRETQGGSSGRVVGQGSGEGRGRGGKGGSAGGRRSRGGRGEHGRADGRGRGGGRPARGPPAVAPSTKT